MAEKLTWEQIEKQYDQQWVELVDCDWPDSEPDPTCGVVRSHSPDKKEFYRQCRIEPRPSDCAIVFVGPPRREPGVVFSPSLMRFESCEK